MSEEYIYDRMNGPFKKIIYILRKGKIQTVIYF